MAAVAYNLKKYLKFEPKKVNNIAKEVKNLGFEILENIWAILSSYSPLKSQSTISCPNYQVSLESIILSQY